LRVITSLQKGVIQEGHVKMSVEEKVIEKIN